jgi:hypothetical protein
MYTTNSGLRILKICTHSYFNCLDSPFDGDFKSTKNTSFQQTNYLPLKSGARFSTKAFMPSF